MNRATIVSIPYVPEITLAPVGCIHWPQTHVELFKEWRDQVASTPNCYTILMGDSLDFTRAAYRGYVRGYSKDENSQQALDDMAMRGVVELARELKPVARRILGILLGNHHWTFLDGTNSEQRLCQELEVPYLGPQGVMMLRMEEKKTTGQYSRLNLIIYCHHSGGSGASAPSGILNALIKQTTKMDADVYLLGHTHDMYAIHDELYVVNRGGAITRKDRILVRTGALYSPREDEPTSSQQHYVGYHQARDLKPKKTGWVTIGIRHSKGNNHSTPSTRMWARY